MFRHKTWERKGEKKNITLSKERKVLQNEKWSVLFRDAWLLSKCLDHKCSHEHHKTVLSHCGWMLYSDTIGHSLTKLLLVACIYKIFKQWIWYTTIHNHLILQTTRMWVSYRSFYFKIRKFTRKMIFFFHFVLQTFYLFLKKKNHITLKRRSSSFLIAYM